MLTIKDVKTRITNIKNKIETLDDLYYDIQNSRKEKSLSLAIYKCDDSEALKLRKIDTEIKGLENIHDRYKKILTCLESKEYMRKVFEERKKQEGYKYKIIINKRDTSYSHSFIDILKECIKNKVDCTVFEYIREIDDLYNKEVNMPFVRDIFKYNSKKNSLTTNIFNSNYGCYMEHERYFDYNFYYHHVTFYDNSKNELGYYMHNIYGDNIITIHNNFGSPQYKSITIVKNNDNILKEKVLDNYEFISKTLNKVRKNKNYKYNINMYENLLGISIKE